jgi:hypothetical protein
LTSITHFPNVSLHTYLETFNPAEYTLTFSMIKKQERQVRWKWTPVATITRILIYLTMACKLCYGCTTLWNLPAKAFFLTQWDNQIHDIAVSLRVHVTTVGWVAHMGQWRSDSNVRSENANRKDRLVRWTSCVWIYIYIYIYIYIHARARARTQNVSRIANVIAGDDFLDPARYLSCPVLATTTGYC